MHLVIKNITGAARVQQFRVTCPAAKSFKQTCGDRSLLNVSMMLQSEYYQIIEQQRVDLPFINGDQPAQ